MLMQILALNQLITLSAKSLCYTCLIIIAYCCWPTLLRNQPTFANVAVGTKISQVRTVLDDLIAVSNCKSTLSNQVGTKRVSDAFIFPDCTCILSKQKFWGWNYNYSSKADRKYIFTLH